MLDPACGTGNFLYVTLEHLKRLEGEVLNALDELGHRQTGLALGGERADAQAGETVDPHNLLGIEINPRAAAIAEVVLWIGYLQWHFRTRGDVTPPIPVIRDFRNIENRDAVLAYDAVELVRDEQGVPVTRWDGVTIKKSPVTGEDIPDEAARKVVDRYVNPQKAVWPETDFVVGNPPFVGNKRMRLALGDGYADALRQAWCDVAESADLVMYWWQAAAIRLRQRRIERFGFITTNSIAQSFNRRVVAEHLHSSEQPISIVFAVPDHPWIDASDGAAVRIAMTVASSGAEPARLQEIIGEAENDSGEQQFLFEVRLGKIHADLKIGPNVAGAYALMSNARLSNRGVIPHGEGFSFKREEADRLGLDKVEGLEKHIRPYLNGRDFSQSSRGMLIIDLLGLSEDDVQNQFPSIYQHVLHHVRPGRTENKRKAIRDNWWLFAEPRKVMRSAHASLNRFIATAYVSKHRVFAYLPTEVLPDDGIVAIALDRDEWLGVLSSAVHVVWANAAGSRLGVGNDLRYNNARCFGAFPFLPVEQCGAAVAKMAIRIETHRKRQQETFPGLTLTSMYNVLEKLRSGEPLSVKEKVIHEQGLVSVLRNLHDELDAAVLDAYGWSDLTPLLRVAHGNDAPADGQAREEAKRAFEETVLERLVALNAERAAEEARGVIRWLRPEFQNPQAGTVTPAPEQTELDTDTDEPEVATPVMAPAAKPQPWPKDAVAQVRAVAEVLASSPSPLSLDDIAARFTARGPWKKRLPGVLEMLVALGRTTESSGRYVAG